MLYTFSDFEIKTNTYAIPANSNYYYSFTMAYLYDKLTEVQADEINNKGEDIENVKFVVVK